MNYDEIFQEFYKKNSKIYNILITHSKLVTETALNVASNVIHLKPDLKFIEEAAMLHDIGIFRTDSPGIGCYGTLHYLCHGFAGREELEKIGLSKHGFVCERHTGTGISLEEIKRRNLPLPRRDMIPVSVEEKIICFADKFFSKNPDSFKEKKTVNEIKNNLSVFGNSSVNRFEEWLILFGEKQE